MNQKEVNRKLSCIFSTDVIGYSRLMDEKEALNYYCASKIILGERETIIIEKRRYFYG